MVRTEDAPMTFFFLSRALVPFWSSGCCCCGCCTLAPLSDELSRFFRSKLFPLAMCGNHLRDFSSLAYSLALFFLLARSLCHQKNLLPEELYHFSINHAAFHIGPFPLARGALILLASGRKYFFLPHSLNCRWLFSSADFIFTFGVTFLIFIHRFSASFSARFFVDCSISERWSLVEGNYLSE